MNEDPRHLMLTAIGSVTMDSNYAAVALQQLAATLTGTDLIYFTLRNMTLGAQFKQLFELTSQATTNPWIVHPPIDAQVREQLLPSLKLNDRFLVPLRNRVVHDIWEPDTEGSSEGSVLLTADRATRWGKSIHTDVTSLYRVSTAFFMCACMLDSAARALRMAGDDSHDSDSSRSEFERRNREFVELTKSLRDRTDPTFRWVETDQGE